MSVSLDAKLWPQRSASPEDDFQQLIRQFPDLEWQFGEATAVRPWTGSEPWQYGANAAAGDGFVVLERSAVRCDFTLSRDVTLTAELVHEAAAHLISAAGSGDWSVERFRPLESFQASLIEHGDRLLRTALTATTDFRLWNAFCRVWLLHSMFAALSLKRARNDALATPGRPDQWRELERCRGAGLWFPVYPGFVALFDDMERLARQVADGRLAPGAAAERIFGQLRSASFVPPLFAFGDPTDRYYNFTPLKRVKVLLWAKRRAPYMVQRVLTRGPPSCPTSNDRQPTHRPLKGFRAKEPPSRQGSPARARDGGSLSRGHPATPMTARTLIESGQPAHRFARGPRHRGGLPECSLPGSLPMWDADIVDFLHP